MERRDFLRLGSLTAATGLFPRPSAAAVRNEKRGAFRRIVDFTGDGLSLSPVEYAAELQRLVEQDGFEADYYSQGGAVEALERRFAAILGKEKAVFLPTGTLANHLAVRRLAGKDRRVLVQAESHFYNDSGDCAGTLSGLTLVPLAQGAATFTLDEVESWVRRSARGRVEASVGVIAIESPVRRRFQEMFGFDEMKKISAFAREQGIRLHLDGARLFNLPFHSGLTIADYTRLFDTIYVSLWKHFNAASGAILAGTAETIDGLFHARRMFGGGLPHAWPVMAVALKYADGYLDEYAKAWKIASALFAALGEDGRFLVEEIPNGTSVLKLRVHGTSPEAFAGRLKEKSIILSPARKDDGVFHLMVNTSLNGVDPRALAAAFFDAARA